MHPLSTFIYNFFGGFMYKKAIVFLVTAVMVLATIGTAKISEKKGVRVPAEKVTTEAAQNVSGSPIKTIVEKVSADPAAGVKLGNTDYDYGWNSGSRRNVVVQGTKVHFQWMHRNGAAGAAPLNRRSIRYQTYDWTGGTLSTATDVVPKATQASGFGAIDVWQTGAAEGIAAVVGHTSSFFAIDGGPASGNFTFSIIRTGILDPSLTIDQASSTGDIYWVDTYDGGRSNIWFQKSTDFGTTWFVPSAVDTPLVAKVAGKQFAAGNLDNEVLIAPNGNLFIATCITGGGAYPGVSKDSADQLGYFKSTDKGISWTWNRIAADGDLVAYGTDTVQNFFENFGSLDAVVDKDNNLHLVIQGYGAKNVFRATDTVAANYFGALYWKTGMTSMKLISRVADAHVGDFDSAYYSYSGNAIGHPYPTLAVDPTGTSVFAAWSQTRIVDGKVPATYNGICSYDLWYAYSNNLGGTWTTAQKLANSDGALFVSAYEKLTSPTANTRRAHFVYIADSVGGSSTGVSTGAPLVDYIYRTVDFSTTSVNDNAGAIAGYSLEQNYPNPFNPSTKISYSIANAGQVNISVYNMLGQEVATLVNGFQTAGTHSVDFKASTLASGVYLYKIQAGNFTDVKKMVMMK